MTAHPMEFASRQPDDLDDRTRRIRDKLLDGIEATLDELAQPRTVHDTVSRAVHRAMQGQRAALLCRQALCRRAQRCRRDPCAVPSEDFRYDADVRDERRILRGMPLTSPPCPCSAGTSSRGRLS